MKNMLLLLLGVIILGGTVAFIVWNQSHEEKTSVALESVIVVETEPVPTEPIAAANEGAPEPEIPGTPEIDSDAEVEVDTTEDTGLPAEMARENADFQAWTTLAGSSFEAKLVWVSKSGKSVRFERPDGSTFVYSTEHLEPRFHDTVLDMVIAVNSINGEER